MSDPTNGDSETETIEHSEATTDRGRELPRAYPKVLRLLRTREFPIDRAEIETVAANAYGLSQTECAAVIDAAIERGRLEETDGTLRPGPER